MRTKEIFVSAVAAVVVALVSKHIIPIFTNSYLGWTIAELIIGIVFVVAVMAYLVISRRREAKKHYHLCANAGEGCKQMLPPGMTYCSYCRCVSEQSNAEPIGAR